MNKGQGKVVLPAVPDPPPEIKALFTDQNAISNEFRDHIRGYNNALNMCSMKVTDETIKRRNANGTLRTDPVAALRISGAVRFFTGPISANPGDMPNGAQVYLLDPDDQINHRNRQAHLNPATMRLCTTALLRDNILAKTFKMANELIVNNNIADARLIMLAEERPADVHERRGNAATVRPACVALGRTMGSPGGHPPGT